MRPSSKHCAGVNALKTLHPTLDGWGTSAMKTAMESKILSGRPYGGTGYVWTKGLSPSIKPRLEYRHERVTVLEIQSSVGPIIVINCYLPYYKVSDLASQKDKFIETISFIDSILNDNPNSSFIIMGDMNCNFYSRNNEFSPILQDFIRERDLYCCYDSMTAFNSCTTYTRFNLKQNSYSLLDYVFVSKSLSNHISKVNIIDSGAILSDHFPVHLSLSIDLTFSSEKRNFPPVTVNWRSLNESSRRNYELVMENNLDQIEIPHIVHGDHACQSVEHIFLIEQYYTDILRCIHLADLQLPRHRPTVTKEYWSEELTLLKNDSIVAHDFWKLNGSPRTGPIFEAKKKSHYLYKLRIRQARDEFNQEKIDSLNENLIDGDHHKFWNSYKRINKSKVNCSPRIDNLTNDCDIANRFADTYKKVYDSLDKQKSYSLLTDFNSQYREYHATHCHDSIKPFLLTWSDMLDVMSQLKAGKATCSFVKPEHILYGSPKLIWHLHLLFNAMIMHSYVPSEFLRGVITPLLKDSEGNNSDPSNYRPLTLSVIFSNLFERALMLKIGHLLETDSLQFGYKRRHSVSHAIYSLKTCVDYFTNRGSRVFSAFLDCSKGFDRVNHHGLFLKLMKRRVPLCILDLIIYWYSNLVSVVKWNDSYSESFSVPSGVRQGGVLSPYFFTIYVDDLIVRLRRLRNGCHISETFLAAIVYADDICLLAPCRSALQKLLNECETYGNEWCLSYNPAKSKILLFGPHSVCPSFKMYGKELSHVNELKYLGVTIVAGKTFSTASMKPLIRFRSSANAILNVPRRSSEPILMKLVYSICVPNLTYASEVLSYSSQQTHSFHVALNDCIRRIFGYNRWESIRHLRLSMGYPSIVDIFAQRKRKFFTRLPTIHNPTLNALAAMPLD